MKELFQLKIELCGSHPLIWRRITIDKACSFFTLHHTIQVVMGWSNYHAFEFNIEGFRIGEIDIKKKALGMGRDALLDCIEIKLADLFDGTEDELLYFYDPANGWRHRIKVEKVVKRKNSTGYPHCLEGRMNCPPEECGGIASFYNPLLMGKIDSLYDYFYFSPAKVNHRLKHLDNYILTWMQQRLS
jgi:hypothetical protein